MQYALWIDGKIRVPYQMVVNWVFTHFGRSHYWLAQKCVHVWMAFTIFWYSSHILLDALSPVALGCNVMGFLSWLVNGYVIALELGRVDADWRVGRRLRFRDPLGPASWVLIRLTLAFIVLVCFPGAALTSGGELKLDPPFVGVLFSCLCVLYLASCEPPSTQRSSRTVSQFG